MYKINVLIITYKQQDVIGRAIESVLIQKDYGLNKIVIADDCSPDNTWDVVSRYEKQYPDIVEAYRNGTNLGIYGNLQKLIVHRGEADFYYKLSGDDMLCDGWFKVVQNYLQKDKLRLDEPIGIFSDWKYILPDGREHVYIVNDIVKGIPLFSLYIRGRGFGSGRSLLISKEVISKYKPLIEGKGLNLTESYFDSQDFRFIKKAIYIPYMASVYYCGIGFSANLVFGKSDYYTKQTIEKWEYFLENFITSKSDEYYARYGIEQAKYYIHPSFLGLYRTMKYYHKGRLDGLEYNIGDYWMVFKPLVRYPIAKFVKRLIDN